MFRILMVCRTKLRLSRHSDPIVLCVFVAELTHVVSPCLDDAAGETEGEQTT